VFEIFPRSHLLGIIPSLSSLPLFTPFDLHRVWLLVFEGSILLSLFASRVIHIVRGGMISGQQSRLAVTVAAVLLVATAVFVLAPSTGGAVDGSTVAVVVVRPGSTTVLGKSRNVAAAPTGLQVGSPCDLGRFIPMREGFQLPEAEVKPFCVRLGTKYGGYEVPGAMPWLNADSVVYTVGVGEDCSFDIEFAARFGVRVHMFDPTPRALKHFSSVQAALLSGTPPPLAADRPGYYVQPDGTVAEISAQRNPTAWFLNAIRTGLPADRLIIHPWGIAGVTGQQIFYAPQSGVSHTLINKGNAASSFQAEMKTIADTMQLLGHDHIDFLKLDIEGEEVNVLPQVLARFKDTPIKAIALDVDSMRPMHPAASRTPQMQAIMVEMQKAGYRAFSNGGGDAVFVHGWGESWGGGHQG
jgi:hypothetical protein